MNWFSNLSKLKKIVLFVVLGLVLVGSTVATIGYVSLQGVFVDTQPIATPAPVVPTQEPEPDQPKPLTVLLLGYGGAGHAGGALTDSMIVARIDPILKRITLISIPRDLWVKLPLSEDKITESKINAAYAIGKDDRKYPNKQERYSGPGGAGTLTKDIVTEITGLSIDYFVSVDFSSFATSIDTLGGLDIIVPYAFEDQYYPIKGLETDPCGKSEEDIAALTATLSGTKLEYSFECRFEAISFPKGAQLMNGETALKFVRSRHSNVNGNDFGRSLRQQALIIAARKKILSLGSVPKMISLATQVSKYVQTDLPISELPNLYEQFPDIQEYQVRSILLTNDNVMANARSADNQFILIPKTGFWDWELIQLYIRGQLESEF